MRQNCGTDILVSLTSIIVVQHSRSTEKHFSCYQMGDDDDGSASKVTPNEI